MSASRDSTKDPSKQRPDDRKVVELGVLTIDKAVPNSDEAKKSTYSCRACSPTGSNNSTIR